MRNAMKTLALAALTITSLSGCAVFKSNQEIEMLNKAQAGGNPFTQQLTTEYRNFSNYLLDSQYDTSDAILFSRKGLDAAAGKEVTPESVSDWNIPLQSVRTFAEQRARLINAYDLGAKEVAPQVAAVAQSRFDCWIEQTESTWAFGQDHDLPCQKEFADAMNQLDQALAGRQRPAPAPTPAPAPEPAPYVPSGPLKNEDAVYLVFFDWDKSQIGEGGMNVVDAAAQSAQGRQYSTVRIVGHTDTSGADGYNQALGDRRATAVKEALSQRGINAQSVVTESRGETDPLVQTGDNVREPANRRATITFE